MRISVAGMMKRSGVKFGTSGARGPVRAMTDEVCYVYARGFLQFLEATGDLHRGKDTGVAVAGDLRPSTPRIMGAVRQAIADRGHTPIDCGLIPSPALALYGLTEGIPSIMVTGSHIPSDRNGIKFNKKKGEILKPDEGLIRNRIVRVDDGLFGPDGMLLAPPPKGESDRGEARRRYITRYLDFFEPGCLSALKIGVYQHSAVGRDILVEILRGLGAHVETWARADEFVPVDTEAIREEDIELARRKAAEGGFFALVSTDGDSDRPLIADETGTWLRGDVACIFCAQFLGADSVSTPVSCNTAVERRGAFPEVRRTRIGSPYVVASMQDATTRGWHGVVGYEANGGFLTDSLFKVRGRELAPLPTRDAVIVHVAVILQARKQNKALSELAAEPGRCTASNRLKEFPREHGSDIIAEIKAEVMAQCRRDSAWIRARLGLADMPGSAIAMDVTDGLRLTFANDEIVHLRVSGNADEFRCYAEADTAGRAAGLVDACLRLIDTLR